MPQLYLYVWISFQNKSLGDKRQIDLCWQLRNCSLHWPRPTLLIIRISTMISLKIQFKNCFRYFARPVETMPRAMMTGVDLFHTRSLTGYKNGKETLVGIIVVVAHWDILSRFLRRLLYRKAAEFQKLRHLSVPTGERQPCATWFACSLLESDTISIKCWWVPIASTRLNVTCKSLQVAPEKIALHSPMWSRSQDEVFELINNLVPLMLHDHCRWFE